MRDFYLGWVDNNTKKAVAIKVRDVVYAFERRFGTKPIEVLVAFDELVEVSDVNLRAVDYLRPGYYYAGPIGYDQMQVCKAV